MRFSDLFDEPADEPTKEPSQPEHAAPAWYGPQDDELAVTVPFGVVIGRSERGVVVLTNAFVHSTGVNFEVRAAARGLTDRESQRLFHDQHNPPDDDDPAPAFLRIGFELADGSRVSNLGERRRRWRTPDQGPPDGPILTHHGGGGGSGGAGRASMSHGFWLWPLPPAGPLSAFCEWPVVEIALSTVEVDGRRLREAAQRVTKLWP
jgi:hypothetical protein